MTSGAEEEWVKAAMSDDTMVVELLVRLHGGGPTPPLPKPAALPLDWSVRQRRSKPVSVKHAQRASPTTPLSWSGATSLSGASGGSGAAAAAGGYEESSQPPNTQKLSTTARSKVNGDSEKSVSKRSRKKKTLAELKDEESTLLKERRVLKREIAAFRMNLEKQRATNENLKRIKIELLPLADREIASVASEPTIYQLQQKTTAGHPIPHVRPITVPGSDVTPQSSTSNNCPEQNIGAASDPKFVLPDLNLAFEEDPCPDVICGVS